MSDEYTRALRRDARRIFLAAVHAAEPAPLVHAALLNAPELHHAARVHILAVGKAATGMATAALETLANHVASCVVIAPHAQIDAAGDALRLPYVRVIAGGHPLPDEGSVNAGHRATELVASARDGDVIVVLLSGGASSLLCRPAGSISLDDYRAATNILMNAGATIDQLNCVRRHIDLTKGGGLARAATGRTIVGLLISDVVGNRLDVIGSGPLSPDSTTPDDAFDVLRALKVSDVVPASVKRHLENAHTQSGIIPNVRMQILADNTQALDASATFAKRLGYDVVRITDAVIGSASAAGESLAGRLQSSAEHTQPFCILAGGETTVVVNGDGVGGRNQEIALAAAIALDGDDRHVLLSAGTDGIDGSTDAAGAIVDGNSCTRMRDAGVDPRAYLTRNDSNRALAASNDLLLTGATGTNVMDVHVLLRGARHAI